MKSMFFKQVAVVLISVVSLVQPGAAAPVLSITSLSGSSAASIPQSTSTFTFAVGLDTDQLEIRGLQFYVQGPAGMSYAAGATALDTPFVQDDVFLAPVAGNAVDQVEGTTVLFINDSELPDHPAFNNMILTYTLDTGGLSVGEYTFLIVGEEFTNSSLPDVISSFGQAVPFTLQVTTAVPEPMALGATTLLLLLVAHRKRHDGDRR